MKQTFIIVDSTTRLTLGKQSYWTFPEKLRWCSVALLESEIKINKSQQSQGLYIALAFVYDTLCYIDLCINIPLYDLLCYRSMPLRVAVIGAGAAGLCALRHLTARPSVFTALGFEQTSDVGGTWVYTEDTGLDRNGLPIHSSMYKNMT